MPAETPCPFCEQGPFYGVEIRGVYDGALFWECAEGHRWHRFPEGHPIRALAEPFVNRPLTGPQP
jgi:hypothetical protein